MIFADKLILLTQILTCRTTAKEKKPSYSSPFDTPI